MEGGRGGDPRGRKRRERRLSPAVWRNPGSKRRAVEKTLKISGHREAGERWGERVPGRAGLSARREG